jgi:hypothetical protein
MGYSSIRRIDGARHKRGKEIVPESLVDDGDVQVLLVL